jgi:phospholipid transport system substrate-binding protein
MLRTLGMFVLFCAAVFAGNAVAAMDARQYVDSVSKEVLGVVNGSLPDNQKQERLQQLFSSNVDIDWMAKFVLGHAWQQASEEQRSRYLKSYRNYLLARYTTNFQEYAGSDYAITDVKSEGGGKYFIGMQVKSPNAKDEDIQAGYRLREDGAGKFLITDIMVEGVSMITTQRSEFGSVFQQKGMDGLVAAIEAKTQSETAALH